MLKLELSPSAVAAYTNSVVGFTLLQTSIPVQVNTVLLPNYVSTRTSPREAKQRTV
jgi:hypothetical protein